MSRRKLRRRSESVLMVEICPGADICCDPSCTSPASSGSVRDQPRDASRDELRGRSGRGPVGVAGPVHLHIPADSFDDEFLDALEEAGAGFDLFSEYLN